MLKLKLEGELFTQEVARAPAWRAPPCGRCSLALSSLAWPIPMEISEKEPEVLLYRERGSKHGHRWQAEPDWG